MKIFFNIEHRWRDSRWRSLRDYKEQVGNEMIAEHEGGIVTVDHPRYGQFIFRDPTESEISPYASLEELTSIRLKDGHFQVG
jgi:hypothetical protein